MHRKQLKLINESVNMLKPDDIAYVTAGCAPLSVRLIELLGAFGSFAGGRSFFTNVKLAAAYCIVTSILYFSFRVCIQYVRV